MYNAHEDAQRLSRPFLFEGVSGQSSELVISPISRKHLAPVCCLAWVLLCTPESQAVSHNLEIDRGLEITGSTRYELTTLEQDSTEGGNLREPTGRGRVYENGDSTRAWARDREIPQIGCYSF